MHSLVPEQAAVSGSLSGPCSVSLPLRCSLPPPRPSLTFREGRASFQKVAQCLVTATLVPSQVALPCPLTHCSPRPAAPHAETAR